MSRPCSLNCWSIRRESEGWGCFCLCTINNLSNGIFTIENIYQGLYSLRRRRLTGIGIPIINLRRSDDRLRFIMGIPILIRRRLLSEYWEALEPVWNTSDRKCLVPVKVWWWEHLVWITNVNSTNKNIYTVRALEVSRLWMLLSEHN